MGGGNKLKQFEKASPEILQELKNEQIERLKEIAKKLSNGNQIIEDEIFSIFEKVFNSKIPHPDEIKVKMNRRNYLFQGISALVGMGIGNLVGKGIQKIDPLKEGAKDFFTGAGFAFGLAFYEKYLIEQRMVNSEIEVARLRMMLGHTPIISLIEVMVRNGIDPNEVFNAFIDIININLKLEGKDDMYIQRFIKTKNK